MLEVRFDFKAIMKGEKNKMKVNVIARKVTVEKDKKAKVYINYYLQLDNGSLIAFKPSFNEDYGKLRLIADLQENEKK